MRNRVVTVAVFGAYGHTGRFIVRELAALGCRLILSGRDAASLSSLAADTLGASASVDVRPATVADPQSLDRMLKDADVVVNAAGPFLDTAIPVIEAAVRARTHYLDVTAEQRSALTAFERFDSPARASGILVLPAMAFYGGLGDLLITAAMDDWREADAVDLAIGLDSWHPTSGTRRTGERNVGPRFGIANGMLVEIAPASTTTQSWTFPPPFGDQEMTRVHLAETILVAQHLRLREFHALLNLAPLRDLHDPATPPPRPIDASGRSAQRFVMDAVVRRGAETRRAIATGRDIYAITAPLIAEAVARITDAHIASGVVAPGAVFPARQFLAALAPHLSLHAGTARVAAAQTDTDEAEAEQ